MTEGKTAKFLSSSRSSQGSESRNETKRPESLVWRTLVGSHRILALVMGTKARM
eukprot:CAMPEP_0113969236 /NCGR_PEP_ID=MMETSP0011_2-20120614/10132_1 /TAXON_ID=101924 /ORGANISM="Rhodosorus marinus" /LENGTH=53 /DNA_ID=CAMNT_0000982725 /DNA_START=174 /DNA_END=335 /DNA_ORIENTATION=+ /assembly_acc=CAM_ASM_000156